MAKRFLILGASSFYGSNFANLVEEKGDVAIRMWHRPDSTLGHSGWDMDDYVYGELGSAPQVAAKNADYVINFISRSLVAESWGAPDLWAQTNVVGTTRLFDDLRQVRFKKFVHVSTPEVYGSVDAWVAEDQRFRPSTPYAASRAAGDMMLDVISRAYQFPAVITRTSNIYGPGQPDHRIVTRAIKCKKEGKTLMLDGAGNSVRNFIHVRDACEATYLVAKKGKVGETYHISGWRALSIRELVEKIGCKWVAAPERLGKDYAYKLDSTKIRKLGWQDKINLEEGLKECESSISA